VPPVIASPLEYDVIKLVQGSSRGAALRLFLLRLWRTTGFSGLRLSVALWDLKWFMLWEACPVMRLALLDCKARRFGASLKFRRDGRHVSHCALREQRTPTQ